MLDEAEIENALKARLAAASLPHEVVWPNQKPVQQRPYFDVSFFGGDREGGALKGGLQIERVRGGMSVAAVVDLGISTSIPNAMAQSVAEAFPEGTLLTVSEGQIILGVPSIRKGFPARSEGEAKEWRVPVIIPYEVTRV